MLLHNDLRVTSSNRALKTALIENQIQCNFLQLDQQSDNVAVELQSLGVQRGDRIAIMMDNSVRMVIALYGILKAGAVFTLVHPSTKVDKLNYMLNDCSVKLLFAQTSLQRVVNLGAADVSSLESIIWTEAQQLSPHSPTLEQIVNRDHQIPADPHLIDKDLCAIIYTSGSTGFPKGVMLTHHNLCNTCRSIATYLKNTEDDVVLSVLPLTFDYGLFQVLTGCFIGFTVVLEKSFAFPAKTLQRIAEVKATGLPGVPTIFSRVLDLAENNTSLDLSSLRYITNTAAALPPSHIDRLQALLPSTTIFSMYGLTECTRVSWLDPKYLTKKRGSVGKAIPNCEVYVVNELGMRLPPGSAGELVVRGSNVMSGYWQNPEASNRCLRDGELSGEKVLYTGDQIYMDEDGFLFFEGRADDLFKSKGEKIYPKEIELILHELEGIENAAVFGINDPHDGQAIVACIEAKNESSISRSDITLHCRKNLESFMVPKHVSIQETLPKSENGKIDKKMLSANFLQTLLKQSINLDLKTQIKAS